MCEFCEVHYNRPSQNDTWICPKCGEQWAGLRECLITLIVEGCEIVDGQRSILHDGQMPDDSEVYVIKHASNQYSRFGSRMEEFKTVEEAVDAWLE